MRLLIFALLALGAVAYTDSNVIAGWFAKIDVDWVTMHVLDCSSEETAAETLQAIHTLGTSTVAARIWLQGNCRASWFKLPPIQHIEFKGPGTITGGDITHERDAAPRFVSFDNITFDGAATPSPLFASEHLFRDVTIVNSRFANWTGLDVIVAMAEDAAVRVENVTMTDIAGSALRTKFVDSVEIVGFECMHCGYAYDVPIVHVHTAWTSSKLRIERSSLHRNL